jgi:hypothetical protein
MSRNVLLSLLRQGSTGSEILQILESITDGVSDGESAQTAGIPTLNPIEF